MAVMDDVFKTNEGDRDLEIKKLEAAMDKNRGHLDKATTMFLDEVIDRNDFKRIKERVVRESFYFQR